MDLDKIKSMKKFKSKYTMMDESIEKIGDEYAFISYLTWIYKTSLSDWLNW